MKSLLHLSSHNIWWNIINFSQQSIPLVPVLNCQSGWTEPRWEQGRLHQGLCERPYCQRGWTVYSLNWILLYVYPGICGDCRTIHCVERGGSIVAWSTNWPWMNISQSCVQCQSWFSLTWETICQSRAMLVHVLLWFRIIKDYERVPTFASHTISMSERPCFTLQLECFGVAWTFEHLWLFIKWIHVTLMTDHKIL